MFDRKRREFITRLAAPQERGRKPIDCCIAGFQPRLRRRGVIRVAPTGSKASPNVRYALVISTDRRNTF